MCNENGTCYCNQTSLGDCFVLGNNPCQLNDCYQYMQEQGTCRKGTKAEVSPFYSASSSSISEPLTSTLWSHTGLQFSLGGGGGVNLKGCGII